MRMRPERWARTKQGAPVAITDNFGTMLQVRIPSGRHADFAESERQCDSCGAWLAAGVVGCGRCMLLQHQAKRKKQRKRRKNTERRAP